MGACTSVSVEAHQEGPESMVIRVQSNSARAVGGDGMKGMKHQQPHTTMQQGKIATLKQRPSSGESSGKEEESYDNGIEKTTRLGSLGSGSSTASATSTQSDSSSSAQLSDARTTMATLTPSTDKSPQLHLGPSHHSAPGPSRPHSLHVHEPSGSPVLTSRGSSPTNVSPLHVRPMLSVQPSASKRESSLDIPNARASVDLSTLMPNNSPRRKGLGETLSSNDRSPALLREPTPTVHTKHIESGITEDGFYHINQYIIEMGRWKREAMKRASARAIRRAERIADRARREAEGGINHEASEDDSEEDSEPEPEESGEEDEDEEATILGRGSYGVVKKVFNTQDGRFYAMKIMSKSLLSNARSFGRQAGEPGNGADGIRREIAIMKKLDHPNIVKLVEVLCDDEQDNVMLVMEFAEGGNIMHVDLDDGEVEFEDGSVNIVSNPLPVETARQYLHDILSGLAYLHHQKVIHRDIKPENLLLSSADPKEARVMIADFGVSTLCEGEDNTISSTAGTACFMSPEMIKSGAKNRGFGGPQTDIWSVGVTLFFMLYGRLPWYSKSLPEIYRMICEDPLVFPSGLEFAHIPVQAQTLIRFMLDKNPKTRATTACMLQCPWVTNGFTWNLESHCKMQGFPEAIEYQHQPLVEATVCSTEIQQALAPSKVVKEASSPVTSPREDKCPIFARMKSRLASWKKEMKRKCDEKCAAKKAARARKRATMEAGSNIAIAQQEVIASIKNPRRATAAPSLYQIESVTHATSLGKQLAVIPDSQ